MFCNYAIFKPRPCDGSPVDGGTICVVIFSVLMTPECQCFYSWPCWIQCSLVSSRLSSLYRTRTARLHTRARPSAGHLRCLSISSVLRTRVRCAWRGAGPHADSFRVWWEDGREDGPEAVSGQTEEISVLEESFCAPLSSPGLPGCPFRPLPLQHTSRALANLFHLNHVL